jgi:NAD(P)-dependent dehydrogenase (short-subunit alcohol dehydrogenase family)
MKAAELFDLSGKVAVITGGAGDIGIVYGRALCEAGASVVLADLNAAAAEAAAGGLTSAGFAAAGLALDVTDRDSALTMAGAAVDRFGGIDILVNNAAVMRDLPRYGLSDMPLDEWNRTFAVNVTGALLCTQAVVPAIEARGGGRIVNGLSSGAFMPGGIYGVTKLALHALTASLATELGPRGINVNAIAPGLIDSESGYISLPKDSPVRAGLESMIPGKKAGPPEDLVGTLLLLCSRAGDWINGQTYLVDGGWIMRL